MQDHQVIVEQLRVGLFVACLHALWSTLPVRVNVNVISCWFGVVLPGNLLLYLESAAS